MEVCHEEGVTEHIKDGVMSMRVRGGAPKIAKVLGQLQPERLLAKFRPEFLGMVQSPKAAGLRDCVVDIRPLGIRQIVRSLVDCGTYIVEGYPHHNSFYQHEEEYLSPQGTTYWRGILLKHEVHKGSYTLLEVSLDYLKRRYSA